MSLSTGFTLVEMMVVLALIGVVLAIAGPSLLSWWDSLLIQRARSEVTSLLASARYDALTKARQIVICPNGDDGNCGTDWSANWLVFVDSNRDGHRQPAEPVLQCAEVVPQGVQVRWSAFRNNNQIVFDPWGQASSSNGRLAFQRPSGQAAGELVLNRGGRWRWVSPPP